MDKTDAVSEPQVPIAVFDTDGQEMAVDVTDLFFAQYAMMVLFRKLGFLSADIHFVQNARLYGMENVLFYGVALITQGCQCLCTTYPRDCIRMNVDGHSVFCSLETALAEWPAYVERANCPRDAAFEERLRQHQIRNITQLLATLNAKGFQIPVFKQANHGN